MKYLIRNRKPNKIPRLAHVWLNNDTACTMASTKGLYVENYKIIEEWAGRLCTHCDAVYNKRNVVAG